MRDSPEQQTEPVVRTVTTHYVDVEVEGYNAEHWHGSYGFVRDALNEHLAQFIRDDDCAEEGILCEAIERLGRALRNVKQDEETGEWIGEPDWFHFTHILDVPPPD